MSDSMKQHLQNALKQNVRLDGRKLLEFRNMNVETGIIKNAEGSARVKFGDTEVLVGVKMAVETPYPDTPDKGNLMVNVELIPLSSPDYESGPPSINAIEVARVVDRGIRESEAIDFKKLVIKKGEKVWAVNIDIVTINVDGNIIDAAALATLAAIKNAVMPTYSADTGVVDYKKLTKTKLPLLIEPIQVTVYKTGDVFLLDPTDHEEKAVDARLTVAVMDDGRLCAMQKGDQGVLSIDEVDEMIGIAIEQSKKIRENV